MPVFGSMVQNGKLAACALLVWVMALNRVLFPTLGKPTTPNFICVGQRIRSFFAQRSSAASSLALYSLQFCPETCPGQTMSHADCSRDPDPDPSSAPEIPGRQSFQKQKIYITTSYDSRNYSNRLCRWFKKRINK